MFPTQTPRATTTHSVCSLLCVCLAFMVFAWGTNYKLSLYNAGHESSPAKVCTRGSDTAKSVIDQAISSHDVAPEHFRTAALFSLPDGADDSVYGRLSEEASKNLSPLSCAPILYLRPPPDEGLALD